MKDKNDRTEKDRETGTWGFLKWEAWELWKTFFYILLPRGKGEQLQYKTWMLGKQKGLWKSRMFERNIFPILWMHIWIHSQQSL